MGNNIVGFRINNLLVVEDFGYRYVGKSKIRFVLARCICGKVKEFRYSNIKTGNTKSCGCLFGKTHEKHNLSSHPLYKIWVGMIQRCYNPKATHYKYYGGRGIFVSHEWMNDFKIFYDWSINNFWASGLKLDRINNEKEYSKYNCRYVTHHINMRNTRSNNIVSFNGESMCMTDWAAKLGIKYCTLHNRINILKWPIEKALTIKKVLISRNQYTTPFKK